jgi:Enoyl-CoA hydratase/isomerase
VQVVEVDYQELQRLTASCGAAAPRAAAGPPRLLLVDLDGVADADRRAAVRPPHGLADVVVGVAADPQVRPELCDLVIGPGRGDLERIAATVERTPRAASTLVELLRCSPGMSLDAGLLAESASYGVLQAGAEFARWRQDRTTRAVGAVPPSAEPVRARRVGDELQLTLHRPGRRNALDAGMRDALVELLELAVVDETITRIVLEGAGPDFCSGGDLDEFGTADDVAVAHLVRLERSIARLLAAVSERLVVHLHGACIGSGIELAAFAATVQARDDVTIGLPELGMGLIPGAGGTVSLTRRIGRHRTCWLALTGARVDAATAHGWGLVDAVDGRRT